MQLAQSPLSLAWDIYLNRELNIYRAKITTRLWMLVGFHSALLSVTISVLLGSFSQAARAHKGYSSRER